MILMRLIEAVAGLSAMEKVILSNFVWLAHFLFFSLSKAISNRGGSAKPLELLERVSLKFSWLSSNVYPQTMNALLVHGTMKPSVLHHDTSLYIKMVHMATLNILLLLLTITVYDMASLTSWILIGHKRLKSVLYSF